MGTSGLSWDRYTGHSPGSLSTLSPPAILARYGLFVHVVCQTLSVQVQHDKCNDSALHSGRHS